MSIFSKVALSSPPTNNFDLSHDVKLSTKMGLITPTCVMEVLPGDRLNISPQTMLRFAPLISPVMHEIDVDTYFFYVPNRIVWAQWEDWISGNVDVVPPWLFLPADQVVAVGSLADYLGIPAGTYDNTPADFPVNVLPFAAYTKIFDEYFRDQNLQTEVHVPLIAGDNSPDYLDWFTDGPLRAAWKHDYLTSALPFAQRGSAVQIPLTSQDNIPVELVNPGTHQQTVRANNNTTASAVGNDGIEPSGTGTGLYDENSVAVNIDPNGTLVVDIQTDAVSINDLRTAWTLQGFLEKMMRTGTRYIEVLRANFGISSKDARLQRPEFIGSSRQKMVISEVLSTAQTTSGVDPVDTPVGQMAGHGISVGGGNNFSYDCPEHGWVIGLMVVRPRTAYQEGIHRSLFKRDDRFDYAWPDFANLGEQGIYQAEVNALFNTTTDAYTTWGYIPRYQEYRYLNSRVAGQFRTTLDFWHLGRIFGDSEPLLNAAFIECNPSTRIFAVEDEADDHIYSHIFNKIRVSRKLPRYAIPAVIR